MQCKHHGLYHSRYVQVFRLVMHYGIITPLEKMHQHELQFKTSESLAIQSKSDLAVTSKGRSTQITPRMEDFLRSIQA